MTHGGSTVVVTSVGLEAVALLADVHGCCFVRGWDAATFEQMLSIPGTMALIGSASAGASEDVAGCALVRIAFDQCEVLTLGVLPAARRRGIGGALVDGILALARDAGTVSVFLEVADDNTAGQALYRAKAFTATGRRRNYYRDDDHSRDAIVMRCDLAPPTRQA